MHYDVSNSIKYLENFHKIYEKHDLAWYVQKIFRKFKTIKTTVALRSRYYLEKNCFRKD